MSEERRVEALQEWINESGQTDRRSWYPSKERESLKERLYFRVLPLPFTSTAFAVAVSLVGCRVGIGGNFSFADSVLAFLSSFPAFGVPLASDVLLPDVPADLTV